MPPDDPLLAPPIKISHFGLAALTRGLRGSDLGAVLEARRSACHRPGRDVVAAPYLGREWEELAARVHAVAAAGGSRGGVAAAAAGAAGGGRAAVGAGTAAAAADAEGAVPAAAAGARADGGGPLAFFAGSARGDDPSYSGGVRQVG